MEIPDLGRINSLLNQVNALMGDNPYKLAAGQPDLFKAAPKNAHYMEKRMFGRLVENIKQDKYLSSMPLCWRQADGSFVILSGHHRIAAAKEAGVAIVLFLYTDENLSRSKQVAIQLSHNAIVGQENPVILTELWRELEGLDFKLYTGLDDGFIEKLAPPAYAKLNDAPLRYEPLEFMFIAPELERVGEAVKIIGDEARSRAVMVAPLEQFDRFFQTLISFKEAADVRNSSTALLMLLNIADEWLANNAEAAKKAKELALVEAELAQEAAEA